MRDLKLTSCITPPTVDPDETKNVKELLDEISNSMTDVYSEKEVDEIIKMLPKKRQSDTTIK